MMMTKMDTNVLNAFDGGLTDVAGFEKEMSRQMTAISQIPAADSQDIEELIARALKRRCNCTNDRKASLHMHLRLKNGANADTVAMTRHELAELAETVAAKGAANAIMKQLANFYVRIAMMQARIEAVRHSSCSSVAGLDAMMVAADSGSKYENRLLAEYAKNEETLREKRHQNQRELDRIMRALFLESDIHPDLTDDDLRGLELQVEHIAERGCTTQELRRLKIMEALLEQRQLDALLLRLHPAGDAARGSVAGTTTAGCPAPDLFVQHYSHSGFFSCCTVKLIAIVDFAILHNSFPKNIDGTGLFKLYKMPEQINQDITHVFFKHPSDSPTALPLSQFTFGHQFVPYSQLEYKTMVPIVKTYFEPSAQIIALVNQLENKYGIDPGNCIAVYYRGTDKITETALDSFHSYYAQLKELLSHPDNHGCKILLQSDSAQFFDYMNDKFRDSTHSANLVIIDEIAPSSTTAGTHKERNRQTNHSDIKHLFAVVLIISKCKHIICSSGNVSQWMMLYRGNAVNVHQSLNLKWV